MTIGEVRRTARRHQQKHGLDLVIGDYLQLIHPDRNNWAPRFGFAYSVAPKLVLRGAYGVFYTHTVRQGREGLLGFNPPFLVDNLRNTNVTGSAAVASAAVFQLKDGYPSGLLDPNSLVPTIFRRAQDANQRSPYGASAFAYAGRAEGTSSCSAMRSGRGPPSGRASARAVPVGSPLTSLTLCCTTTRSIVSITLGTEAPEKTPTSGTPRARTAFAGPSRSSASGRPMCHWSRPRAPARGPPKGSARPDLKPC